MSTVIVEFINVNRNFREELEIPLDITANDLIYALNSSYSLGLDNEDYFNYYLSSENPIAFLKGNKQLSEYGLRNGTKIIYKRG